MFSQLTRTKPSWQDSAKTKPTNSVRSAIYMKKLVYMSISHIIYLRGLMPEHAFEDREFDGVDVKILSEKSGFGPAVQIISWLKGAFEAFDKNYLEKLEFIFYNDGPNPTISENYAFSFTYNEGNITISCENKTKEQSSLEMKLDDVRMSVVTLLRHTTALLKSLTDITQPISMRVRLFYYDEVTPHEYEPPGFKKAEPTEYVFEKAPMKFRHGEVKTGFHSVSLGSKISKSNFRRGNDAPCSIPEGATETKKHASKLLVGLRASKDPSERPRASDEVLPSQQLPANNSAEPLSREAPEESGEGTPSDVRNADVYCACGKNFDTEVMVLCVYCRRWNHASCYRYYEVKSLPTDFCCVFCHKSEAGASCNDLSLLALSPKRRQIICLYRRALINCMSAWRIDRKTLMSELSIPEDFADLMLQYMMKDKVFFNRRRGRGSYFHIDSGTLQNEVVAKYLVQGCVQLPDIDETEGKLAFSTKKMSLAELPVINSDNLVEDKSDGPLTKRKSLQGENSDENVLKLKKRKLHESNEALQLEPSTSRYRM